MKIIIDGKEIETTPGRTILEVAREAGIDIPTLCYSKAFGGKGACRMCMVEVTVGGSSRLVASCTYPITREIEVRTSTPEIEKVRRTLVMLLYKRAPGSPLMQKLYEQYQCPENALSSHPEERCILCRLCVEACSEMGAGAISAIFRGTDKRISTPYDEPSSDCIGCAACAGVCPTGAIEMTETENTRTIWNRTFDLVLCERCGQPLGTREQLEYVRERTGLDSAPTLCEDCRKKTLAGKLVLSQP